MSSVNQIKSNQPQFLCSFLCSHISVNCLFFHITAIHTEGQQELFRSHERRRITEVNTNSFFDNRHALNRKSEKTHTH